MKTLGIIPARGGSKGIPGKNLVRIGGKPLIRWTIDAAIDSGVLDRIIVSTDDHEIAQVARECGAEVPFMRPDALSGDTATSASMISHAVEALDFDGTVVLLQPTSPLRTANDITNCLTLHRQHKRQIVSVTETKIHASWMFGLEDGDKLVVSSPVATQRQNGRKRYIPNGAVYVFEASTGLDFNNAVGYVMPADRSIDIDTPFDLLVAEMLIARRPGILTPDQLQAVADSFA